MFLAPCCSSFTWGFHPVSRGDGLGCWQILPWGTMAGGSNSKLCHSEAGSGGWCVKHQQLGSVPICKTELGSFWGRLCRVLVLLMLCRSEDQLASPSSEQGILRGCRVEHLRAGKSSHCFWEEHNCLCAEAAGQGSWGCALHLGASFAPLGLGGEDSTCH